MFSLTLDYDNGSLVSVKGYAELWQWSRGKVARFLERIGATICYPGNTNDIQNQRGQIMIQMPDRSRTDSGQIKIIDSKWLGAGTNRSRADNEQITSRSQSTTIEPKPKPIKRTSPAKNPPADFTLFRDWWMHAFSRTEDDRYIFESAKDGSCISSMLKAVDLKEVICKACHYLVDSGRFPKGRPTISGLKTSINRYPGHINGQAERFRELELLPPDGVLLEDWQPWKTK